MAENSSAVCMKHGPRLNKRFYHLLNKLHGDDNVIPKEYQKRVGALICTCDKRADLPVRNDPFTNVTCDDLINAVRNMDVFLITHNQHDKIDAFKQLMTWLRVDGLIPSDSSQQSQEVIQKSSAHRFLYILHQCLMGNLKFLDPPPPLNDQNQPAPERTLTFVLENCHHSLTGSIIGRNGSNLKPLLKRFKCHIKVDRVGQGEDRKIKVTVKKKTMSMETLERVKQEIENNARDVVQDERRYKEHREQEEREHREDFKTLLQQTPGMGRNAAWSDIKRVITGNVRYYSISRAIGRDVLETWFDELRVECYPLEPLASSSSGSSSGRTFAALGSSLRIHHNEFSDEEPEDTPLKGVTPTANLVVQTPTAVTTSSNLAVQTSTAVTTSSNLAVQTPTAVTTSSNLAVQTPTSVTTSSNLVEQISSSLLRSNLNLQPRAEVLEMASNSCLSANYSQPLSTAQEGRLSVGNRRSSLCLVHDRRWVSTYQFTLTKCFVEINLEKRYGRAFSRFVCCCQGNVPDVLQHFVNQSAMKDAFKSALDKIKNWPMETEDIMQPLVRQLEKVEDGELWQSLYRFVFLFLNVLEGKTDYLKEKFRLPFDSTDSGEGIIVCQEDSMQASQSGQDSVVTSNHKVTEGDRDNCYFHGRKKRAAFQCLLNYIHTNGGLPQKYRSAFGKAVCCCNEDSSSEPVDQEDGELRNHCSYMKSRLSVWRGDSSKNIKNYITLLDGFLERNIQLERGFQKLVYFFNCAYKKEYNKFKI